MRLLTATASLIAVAAASARASAQSAHAEHHRGSTPALAAATASPRDAHVVTVTARDYAFDAPDTILAGLTTIRLLNRGPEPHHATLIRLENGKRIGDFHAALTAGPLPGWAHEMGGPNAPPPNGETQATLDLAPGNYLITCYIPSVDGVPHFAKGMTRELVVAPPRRSAPRPAAYVAPGTTMTLTDYDFQLSAPLVAGTQTVRVRNAAAQSHEVVFVRLAPGRTAADFATWMEKPAGPPPGVLSGGTTPKADGEWNDLAMTLQPGEYALLCFVPDARDGKPHVAHGMIKQISISAAAAPGTRGTRR